MKFGFRLKSIFDADHASLKHVFHLKSYQKWPKNNP